MGQTSGYLQATRHPWSCLVFVLPLLLIYEIGLHFLGGGPGESLRNGADAWFRLGLTYLGMKDWFWAPVLLGALLVVWSFVRRHDRPDDFVGVWVGMAVESIFFALGLWAVSKGLHPLLEGLAPRLDAASGPSGQIISFIGAGIYEEVLFRLILLPLAAGGLKLCGLTTRQSIVGAVLATSLFFSAAHYVGPLGQTLELSTFIFRFLAGTFFAALFVYRGFGIAAASHAFYDILVGLCLTA